ncbi:MAG: 23S rRNA (uracil(1939)-C(5))-methyltransferase RlmD [Armatimonadetes bacterium]|nr:23S rRNA (uracil(1939)-C(5))-methyltransferase RlmD [Armatimonadota bacterium]
MSDDAGLSIGQEVTLTVDSLAFGGEGVGRSGGMAVFIPFVCPGETVQARVTEVHKRFARGELVEVTTASADRVTPFCPLYGRCGGCQLQHLDYPAQLAAKTRAVKDALTRLGRLPDVPVDDTVPCPLPLGYRNKIELHAFRADDGHTALGYHTRDEQGHIEVDNCPLAIPEVNQLLEQVTSAVRSVGWPAYDPDTTHGLLRMVGLRHAVSTREANLLLVTGRRDVPEKAAWVQALQQASGKLVGVRHVARTRASQSRLGRSVGELFGRPLRFKWGGLSLRVSPEAFFQVNDLLLDPLWEHIHDALAPEPADVVLDVYGGVGTYGLRLAHEVASVTIVEVDHAAAADAYGNARHNQLGNVTVVRGQAEQVLSSTARERKPTLIVLDPPRQGCSDGVLRVAAGQGARRIVYVSCDPTTLARDLAKLAGMGYNTTGVRPFDLFPQTYHVECVATLAQG